MHTRDVEGLAGIARAVFVMLLENFVKSHKVEVDVLFQRQELLRDGIRLGLHPIDRGLIVEVGPSQLVLDLLNLSPQVGHHLESVRLHLGQLGIHLGEEVLVGNLGRRHGRQTPGVGRWRGRDGHRPRYLIGTVD